MFFFLLHKYGTVFLKVAHKIDLIFFVFISLIVCEGLEYRVRQMAGTKYPWRCGLRIVRKSTFVDNATTRK